MCVCVCVSFLVAALHHCTCSLGCKHERERERQRGDACRNARQEEASYLIECDKRFRLELIDVSLVKDGPAVADDDRNRLIFSWNKTHFVGKLPPRLKPMICLFRLKKWGSKYASYSVAFEWLLKKKSADPEYYTTNAPVVFFNIYRFF